MNRFFALGLMILWSMPVWAMRPSKPIGASVAAGLPHPLNVEAEYRFAKTLGFALIGGSLSLPMQLAGQDVNLSTYNVGPAVRWHPFRDAMYVGLATGWQSFSASTAQKVEGVPISIKAQIQSLYITPHLGFLFVFKSGLSVGIEFGAQFSTFASTKSELHIDDPAYAPYESLLAQNETARTQVANAASGVERIGKKTFPHITLLKLGWFF